MKHAKKRGRNFKTASLKLYFPSNYCSTSDISACLFKAQLLYPCNCFDKGKITSITSWQGEGGSSHDDSEVGGRTTVNGKGMKRIGLLRVREIMEQTEVWKWLEMSLGLD